MLANSKSRLKKLIEDLKPILLDIFKVPKKLT